mgnify:CR=1 FL=1
MNKYQEALNRLKIKSLYYADTLTQLRATKVESEIIEDKKTVQELVDRATPMKPTYEHALFCDKCFNQVVTKDMNFCPNCGQALDWSNE